MADTRGVFSLIEVVPIKLEDNWVPLTDVWIASSSYYSSPSNDAYVTDYLNFNKLPYSSETIQSIPATSLNSDRSDCAVTGTPTAGYFGGNPYTYVPNLYFEKLDYLTDSMSTSTTISLSNISRLAGTGNATAGYFGGGIVPQAAQKYSSIFKLSYSADTLDELTSANLSNYRYAPSATGNSTAGYFGGGYASSAASTMDKLTYSTDTSAYTPTANLITPRYGLSATGNSTAGYFGGGAPATSAMNKLTYSTNTILLVPGANLTAVRYAPGATGNSNAGYFFGGAYTRIVDKVTYSTETTAYLTDTTIYGSGKLATSSLMNSLPVNSSPILVNVILPPKRYIDGATGIQNAGYFAGGNGNSYDKTVERISYETDTTSIVDSARLSITVPGGNSVTGNSNDGYFASSQQVQVLNYGLETTKLVPSANLINPRYGLAATGNSTAGYFGAGYYNSTFLTTMDKLTYSNNTVAQVPTAPISSPRQFLAATGNSTVGYFGGGSNTTNTPNPQYATMDKLTYSTDTAAATPTANLSAARNSLSAKGNSTSAYFCGGKIANTASLSTTDKLTYSTDTTVATPTANLNTPRHAHASTGNSTAGYFAGGYDFPGSYDSSITKINYSNDTIQELPQAVIRRTYASGTSSKLYPSTGLELTIPNSTPTPTSSIALSSTQNTGYFGGGIMDKINYSTDTTGKIPTSTPYYLSDRQATGNYENGYFSGGGQSSIFKLYYLTDASYKLPSKLPTSRTAQGATGNLNAGYFSGGKYAWSNPPIASTTDKIIYSTDTSQSAPTANLSSPRRSLCATGNQTSGYFGGGYTPSAASTMDKLTYSTDTTAQVPGARLSAARGSLSATGNSTAGYFGGGYISSPASTMDKLTYSTDTTAQVPGARLSAARYSLGATGNSTAGYFGGGKPGPVSTMDKVNYSTDTTAQVPSASLSAARYNFYGELSSVSAKENGLAGTALISTYNLV